ncbi:MAG TPA: YggT family protein [Acidimicrobiales bacterium]|nr:YggT family protein [Acidimicrobiales bacterium]
MGIICSLLGIYVIIVFLRIIISWFPVSGDGPVATIGGVLYTLTEPVLGPIRRALPPVRLGGMGLDLSPIIVLFGIQILRGIIC